jgi:imidazole glycerol-phosphate synthase subunit HisF
MIKKRLIPVLLLKNGFLVRSHKFERHNSIGNPLIQTTRYNDWAVDELIYIDITRDDVYDLRRDDQKLQAVSDPIDILKVISETCFMPLTFGGGIRTLEDMSLRFENGADKVMLNTVCFENPELITLAAKKFGSQAIVVGVDVKFNEEGEYEVYSHSGSRPSGWTPEEWVCFVEKKGAGEIFLKSIDRDGTGEGYDVELIKKVVNSTTIPVIACGGVGKYEDFVDGVNAGASAVAAGNIFNFKELSDRNAKRTLLHAGVNVRNW